MQNKFLWIIIGSAIINYGLRLFPVLTHNGGKTGKFLKSFLEYIPYAALGSLLFPDVFYSTGNIQISIIALTGALILLLLKRNMIIVVFSTVFIVYLLNMWM